MGDILAVEVGDWFRSQGTGTVLEVVKIWFEYSQADQRWETSVTWTSNDPVKGYDKISAKGREFIQALRSGNFERMTKTATTLSNSTITVRASVGTTAPAADPRLQKWEDDFRRHASKYGLQPTDLGRKVNLGRGRPYTIIGAKPRNYKMPIMVKGRKGGIYKITAEKARAGLV